MLYWAVTAAVVCTLLALNALELGLSVRFLARIVHAYGWRVVKTPHWYGALIFIWADLQHPSERVSWYTDPRQAAIGPVVWRSGPAERVEEE